MPTSSARLALATLLATTALTTAVSTASGEKRVGGGAGWLVGALPTPPAAAGVTEPGQTLVLRAEETNQVLFRGGEFTMGSEPTVALVAMELCKHDTRAVDACEFPLRQEGLPLEELVQNEVAAHPVTLSPFWLDRTEVTVEAYARCLAVGACAKTQFQRTVTPQNRLHPITGVSHEDARTYCAFRGGRLPTEAEWERAAKGLRGRTFPWGNELLSRASNHGTFRLIEIAGERGLFSMSDETDGFQDLAPVGSFPAGRTPEGLEDMAGNVAEWVLDNYADRYDPVSAHDPKGPASSPFRVIRGGSFVSGPSHLRTSARSFASPGVHHPAIGFRCARPG